jgi:TPR repeat protein
MSSLRARSSLVTLLLAAAAGVAGAQPSDGAKCEGLLLRLPVMKTPEMRAAYDKPDATLETVLKQIDLLAANGRADAQYAVGRMMQHGVCAQQNTEGALAYLTRAAQSGVYAAQAALAEAYYAGKDASPPNRLDIAPDPVHAYMWYRVIGDQEGLLKVRRRMVPSEVNEAEKLAREQIARQTPKQ